MRVMLDTNVIVSALVFPTKEIEIMIDKLTEHHEIVICDYVVNELWRVVEKKFPDNLDSLASFLILFPFEMVYVPPQSEIAMPDMRDRADIPILLSALREDIDVLITGDKDFLSMNIDRPIMCTIRNFIENF